MKRISITEIERKTTQFEITRNYLSTLDFSILDSHLKIVSTEEDLDKVALSVLRSIKNSSLYYITKITLHQMNLPPFTFTTDMSAVEITATIEYIKTVLESNTSCGIWSINTNTALVRSPKVLTPDSNMTTRIRPKWELRPSDFYTSDSFDKLIKLLEKDRVVTEYEYKGYLNNELVSVESGKRNTLPTHSLCETSSLIWFAGEPCVLSEYHLV